MARCKLVLHLCLVFVVICFSGAQQECRFDSDEGRILACGVGTNSITCLNIMKIEAYRTVLISPIIGDFHNHLYDVHAFRLCDGQRPEDVTLADGINSGERCQERVRMGNFRAITFQGCDEYFEDNSNEDLTIYAYEDVDGCNGDLLYRFLLINGTGMMTHNLVLYNANPKQMSFSSSTTSGVRNS